MKEGGAARMNPCISASNAWTVPGTLETKMDIGVFVR